MKNKWIWILIALVLVAGVAWAAAPAFKKKTDGTATGGVLGGLLGGSGSGGNTNAAPQLNETMLLKKGSTGDEVKALQLLLNKVQTANPLVVDGIFGSLTENKLYAVTGNKYRSISLAEARKLATAAGVGTSGNLWTLLYGGSGSTSSSTDSTGFWGWLNGLVTQ